MPSDANEEQIKSEFGLALRLIARFCGISTGEISRRIGRAHSTVNNTLNGDKSSDETRGLIAAVLAEESGQVRVHDRDGAIEYAAEIERKLQHWAHFPRILKEYRAVNKLTQGAVGEKVSDAESSKTRENIVRRLENSSGNFSMRLVMQWLSRLGFESMGELIEAAKLSEEYPPLPEGATHTADVLSRREENPRGRG